IAETVKTHVANRQACDAWRSVSRKEAPVARTRGEIKIRRGNKPGIFESLPRALNSAQRVACCERAVRWRWNVEETLVDGNHAGGPNHGRARHLIGPGILDSEHCGSIVVIPGECSIGRSRPTRSRGACSRLRRYEREITDRNGVVCP